MPTFPARLLTLAILFCATALVSNNAFALKVEHHATIDAWVGTGTQYRGDNWGAFKFDQDDLYWDGYEISHVEFWFKFDDEDLKYYDTEKSYYKKDGKWWTHYEYIYKDAYRDYAKVKIGGETLGEVSIDEYQYDSYGPYKCGYRTTCEQTFKGYYGWDSVHFELSADDFYDNLFSYYGNEYLKFNTWVGGDKEYCRWVYGKKVCYSDIYLAEAKIKIWKKPIPEASSMAMLGLGLIGLGMVGRFRLTK